MKWPAVMAVVASIVAANADEGNLSVGPSVPGVFITPPQAAGGVGVTVPVAYTPLGTGGGIVRLNDMAWEGVCATLDGFAERFYFPTIWSRDVDPMRPDSHSLAHDDNGRLQQWRSFNFDSYYNWNRGAWAMWPMATNRNFAAAWRRIFPRARDMLSGEVAPALRRMVRLADDTFKDVNRQVSSSLFGGSDIVSFDWCDRDAAQSRVARALNDDMLCPTYADTADCNRAMAVGGSYLTCNAAAYTCGVGTNYCRRDYTSTLPAVTSIIYSVNGGLNLPDGWLDRSNYFYRIDAGELGWVNSLLAMTDKSYHLGHYGGMPVLQYRSHDVTYEATATCAVTNGTAHLSVVGGSLVATVRLDCDAAQLAGVTANTNDVALFDRLNWSSSGLGARFGGMVAGGTALGANPELLADMCQPLSTGDVVTVGCVVWPDDIGRAVFDLIMQPPAGPAVSYRVGVFPTDLASVSDVNGRVTLKARCDVLRSDDVARPYADIGETWVTNKSCRCLCPNADVRDRFRSVAVQTCAEMRVFEDYVEGDSSYWAGGRIANMDRVDEYCMADANTLAASGHSRADELTENMTSDRATSIIGDWCLDQLQQAVSSATNATWGVAPAENVTLRNEDGKWRLFSNGSELPTISPAGDQAIGSIEVHWDDQSTTNTPSVNVEVGITQSMAIYWNYYNLPIVRGSGGESGAD